MAVSKGYSIRVNIGGKSFRIISDEKPEYLSDVADRVDKSISAMLFSNPSLTYEKAAVLAALKFCDDATKREISENNIKEESSQQITEEDNLRKQVVEYSNELSKLTKENKLLHKSLAELRKDYEEKLTELKKRLG